MPLPPLRSAVLLALACACFSANAQKVQNVRASFDGEKMVITYDLLHDDPNQKFKVAVFSSHDSYARPLSLVTGDVGETVLAHTDNRVVWDVRNTLPADFDGEITIKIKAGKAIVADAIKLTLKPFDKSAYKKGESLEVRWVGGSSADQVNIDLLQGGVVKKRVAEKINNTQHYTWNVSRKESSGKGFILRVSNAAVANETTNSQFFAIKPRVPLIVKVAPVLVVGAVVAFLPKKGGEDPPGETESDLPGPVKPN